MRACALVIDVLLCTHDPRPGILERALASLARQRGAPGAFRVLLVDNGSSPPLAEALLAPLRGAGVEARLVREAVPGLARARLRGVAETDGRWLLLLDDDNELREDYVAEALRFAEAHPDVGAFGGKLLLPPGLSPPAWTAPFHTWLAIKDAGEEEILGASEDWGPWEPSGAGALVRRDVAEEWRLRFGGDDRTLRLGRTGKGLASCEDSLLMRQAVRLGLRTAFTPRLVLFHHLDPARFRVRYLYRLMHAYGRSIVELEQLVKGRVSLPPYYDGRRRFLKTLRGELREWWWRSLPYAVAKIAYHVRARRTYLRLQASAPTPAPAMAPAPAPPAASAPAPVAAPAPPAPAPPPPAPAPAPASPAVVAPVPPPAQEKKDPTLGGRFGMGAALTGLAARGYRPGVVYDVGAADGQWSGLALRVWPDAKVVCFEPLVEREAALAELTARYPGRVTVVPVGVGDADTELTLAVTEELYASSFAYARNAARVVPVRTLDSLVAEGRIPPPSFVKLDVQGFEERVLRGGSRALESAELVLMECQFIRFCDEMRTLDATIADLSARGFVPYEFVEFLRRPLDGAMGQCDILFVRRTSPLVADRRWGR
jgi:FkbM family methyltransferase